MLNVGARSILFTSIKPLRFWKFDIMVGVWSTLKRYGEFLWSLTIQKVLGCDLLLVAVLLCLVSLVC